MIETVIVDLDGPILDGRRRHHACYRDILHSHGRSPLTQGSYWTLKRNRVDRRHQLAATGDEDLYEDFLREWLARIETRPYLELDDLQPGALSTLDQWKSMRIRVILVTMRHDRAMLDWQIGEIGLRSRFDVVLTADPRSPNSSKDAVVLPYLLGRPRARTVWIGDTEVDVAAARQLKVPACTVTCGLRSAEYLGTLSPDTVVGGIADIRLEAIRTT